MHKLTMAITASVAIALIANGAWMLAAPYYWFAATPIVWRTGVPNLHFIRDVGWSYASVGALLIGGLIAERFRSLSLALANIWLADHAAIHLGEAATGVCSDEQFLRETPQVWGPLILLLIAALLGHKREEIRD